MVTKPHPRIYQALRRNLFIPDSEMEFLASHGAQLFGATQFVQEVAKDAGIFAANLVLNFCDEYLGMYPVINTLVDPMYYYKLSLTTKDNSSGRSIAVFRQNAVCKFSVISSVAGTTQEKVISEVSYV